MKTREESYNSVRPLLQSGVQPFPNYAPSVCHNTVTLSHLLLPLPLAHFRLSARTILVHHQRIFELFSAMQSSTCAVWELTNCKDTARLLTSMQHGTFAVR
jgi:hypothetical protein